LEGNFEATSDYDSDLSEDSVEYFDKKGIKHDNSE
jgi:hypothetical protein